MPQYELSGVGTPPVSDVVRGLSPEDAVRRRLDLPASCRVEVLEADDLRGWLDVVIDGAASGRIRPHHRMRFRRD